MAYSKISATKLINAIEGSGGFITTVAQRLGVSRNTVYKALKKYPSAQEALQDEKEKLLDMAEGVLLKNVKAGKEASLFFFLKTQGKKRGYVERQQIEQASAPEGQTLDEWKKKAAQRIAQANETLQEFEK